jgi:hypothetical protein
LNFSYRRYINIFFTRDDWVLNDRNHFLFVVDIDGLLNATHAEADQDQQSEDDQ